MTVSNFGKISRRLFLERSVTAAVTASFLGTLVRHLVSSAHGANPVRLERYYLFTGFIGAPSRWSHDFMLTPNGAGDRFAREIWKHPQIITRAVSTATGYAGQYETIEANGYHVPVAWEEMIPTAAGGLVPMSRILDHALIFRGVTNPSEVHSCGPQTNLGKEVSLDGSIADSAQSPIAGLGISPSAEMSTRSGNRYVYTGFNGLVRSIGKGPLFDLLDRESVITRAEDLAKMLVSTSGSVAVSAAKNEAVRKLFRAVDVPALLQSYQEAYQRYLSIGLACLNPALYPKTLLSGNLPYDPSLVPLHQNANPAVAKQSYGDLMLRTDPFTAQRLADAYASAEVLFKNRITHVLNLTFGAPKYGDLSVFFDAHGVGSLLNLFSNVVTFRTYSAMLYEFTQRMKALPSQTEPGRSLFDQMLIHSAGDFARFPDNEGVGSGHAARACVVTSYSGMFSGLKVVGDIQGSHVGNLEKHGCWGEAAPVPELANRELNLGRVLSTLADIMGVESPSPNDSPVIKVDRVTRLYSGLLAPRRPKNV